MASGDIVKVEAAFDRFPGSERGEFEQAAAAAGLTARTLELDWNEATRVGALPALRCWRDARIVILTAIVRAGRVTGEPAPTVAARPSAGAGRRPVVAHATGGAKPISCCGKSDWRAAALHLGPYLARGVTGPDHRARHPDHRGDRRAVLAVRAAAFDDCRRPCPRSPAARELGRAAELGLGQAPIDPAGLLLREVGMPRDVEVVRTWLEQARPREPIAAATAHAEPLAFFSDRPGLDAARMLLDRAAAADDPRARDPQIRLEAAAPRVEPATIR